MHTWYIYYISCAVTSLISSYDEDKDQRKLPLLASYNHSFNRDKVVLLRKGHSSTQSLLMLIFIKYNTIQYSSRDSHHKATNTTYLALNTLSTLGRKSRSLSLEELTLSLLIAVNNYLALNVKCVLLVHECKSMRNKIIVPEPLSCQRLCLQVHMSFHWHCIQ